MTLAEAAASRSTWLTRELASLPGRCSACAWHIATQGHEEHCPLGARAAVALTADGFTKNPAPAPAHPGPGPAARPDGTRAAPARLACEGSLQNLSTTEWTRLLDNAERAYEEKRARKVKTEAAQSKRYP